MRRHHLSLATGGVLAAAATASLTSTAFEIESGARPSPAAAVQADTPVPPPTATTIAPFSPTPSPRDEWRTVIYYIVESDQQAAELYQARRSDMHFLAAQGLPPLPPVQVFYVQYASRQEELEGQHLLWELSTVLPYYNVDLHVVDVRR